MQRRSFLKSVATAGALACGGTKRVLAEAIAGATLDPLAVKRVVTIFKCHFDLGFVDTQAHIIDRYFTKFFPEAIRTAAASREPGGNRYVWTTGSWLLYEYLEQASSADRKRMEDAIHAGDICWHALPFNWQTELMDASQVAGGLALSRELDRRYGKTTTGAKMTDVPGHTRGLIAPLAAGGVTFLDIGVNGGSRPAEVPPLFVWKDAAGHELTVMYHHEYGAVMQVPGSDLAIAVMIRGDNSGPHNEAEIATIYGDLHRQFPNAQVLAGSLADVADAIHPFRGNLPIVTQEMGDTWIYGCPSDPAKMARYREVSRLRQRWIAAGEFRVGDATDVALLRQLLLESEHTWGTDTKTWLDFDHYKPGDLASMLNTKNYKVVEFSWQEKRQDLLNAVATLPEKLRTEANHAIEALSPVEPGLNKTSHIPSKLELDTPHFKLRFNPSTGAIEQLRSKGSGREWASADHPLALLSYQTLSEQDYTDFFANYIIKKADWVAKDFGKPNVGRFGAVSQTWHPAVQSAQGTSDAKGQRILLDMVIQDPQAIASGRAAFPARFVVEVFAPHAAPEIHVDVSWFRKPATRMPEALWLTFRPELTMPKTWKLDKCGEQISALDVVAAGGRHMHGVWRGLECSEGSDTLRIDTLDAPVVAVGERSPLNFARSQPDLDGGMHFSLFNNAWGTNYVQWYGEDARFRFVLHP